METNNRNPIHWEAEARGRGAATRSVLVVRVIAAAVLALLVGAGCARSNDITEVSEGTVGTLGTVEGTGKVLSDYFSGLITLSPDGTPEDVSFEPVHSRPRRPVSHAIGEYNLELRSSAGVVLRSVPFGVSESVVDVDPELSDKILDMPRQASFSLIVSEPPDYSKFAITHSGKDLIVVERSSDAPTLFVNGPAEGQKFSHNEIVELSWSSSTRDDIELDYIVYYSTDGGSTYNVISLAGDRTSTSLDSLDGSEQARLAVSASDGTRSTFVETPIFAIGNHPPEVSIVSPAPSVVLAGAQGFLLDGWAYDREDGFLSSSSFSWSSDLDGYLGSASFLVLSAADFTEGNHVVTLTVTDKDGATATATTSFTISRENQLPVANDDVIEVVVDDKILIDVLANDIDVEGDFKGETMMIFDQAFLGTAEIAKYGWKYVVEYSSGAAGTDIFTYFICDGGYDERCDIAQVTVNVVTEGCTIFGTEEDDTLQGTSGSDVICGLGGDDTIYGHEGDDIIRAGLGDDTIYGGPGNDMIFGGFGNDNVSGNIGDDIVYGGLGDDQIWGGDGEDTIWGGHGADKANGEADNDTICGEDGPDQIDGGGGADTIHGGLGDDTIRGNQGADIIFPGEGKNTVIGLESEDTIVRDPRLGDDTIFESSDKDTRTDIQKAVAVFPRLGHGEVGGIVKVLDMPPPEDPVTQGFQSCDRQGEVETR